MEVFSLRFQAYDIDGKKIKTEANDYNVVYLSFLRIGSGVFIFSVAVFKRRVKNGLLNLKKRNDVKLW